jgi:23S rRNA (cytosine1962-C5)-methyltransferase
MGEFAVIYDRNDQFLAIGLYDPDSPIRVRILHAGKPQVIDAAWWQQNLSASLQRRTSLFGKETTGYRCINGENDSWPALVLDKYDTTLVLKIYSGIWLQRLPDLAALLNKHLPNERIVLRLSRNLQSLASQSGWTDGQILSGSPLTAPVVFRENDLRFEADVLRGQKTGFFLDQRENRRIVESLARDRSLLNAFSFSGGFSIYAARGGASSVVNLDISAHALASAERNFALNHDSNAVARCQREAIQADVFHWLQENHSRRFDLVILDPPSLAKREAERLDAIRAYEKLTEGGIDHLTPGGILVSASCSAHVSTEEFFGAVRTAARKSGRSFVEMQTTGHAPDHPARFKEAEYLKCIYLQFK